MEALREFFLLTQGKFRVFRFRDWKDWELE